MRSVTRPLSRRLRSLLTIGGWLAATAAATTVGVIAVDTIGSGIAGSTAQPLSAGEVSRTLATATPEPTSAATATPTSPAPGNHASAGGTRVLGTQGGTVVARCVSGNVKLVSWSPAQGYEADDIQPGPATTAGLQFEADHDEITIRVDCRNGTPTSHTSTETRRHG